MKIGIVLPSVPGYSETFFKSKILGLQAHGFEVMLFVKNGKGRKNYLCPVKVHPKLSGNAIIRAVQSFILLIRTFILAPTPALRLWRIARADGSSHASCAQAIVIASAILPEKLDWLHFGFATPAIQREYIGAAIQAKVAVSFRGFDINQTPLLEKNPYVKLWPQVDKVHTISDCLLKSAYKLGLSQAIPAVKITPAIDTNTFVPGSGLPKPKSILMVSRLHWIKGIEYALEGFALVAQSEPELSLSIVGEGSERERLLFAAHQLGISKQVSFMGKRSKEEIILAMQSHEIYLQYSLQEGFGNAALEAQACGMLCVVSNADGLLENVLHEETGWVVPKRNPEALAKQIREVLTLDNESKENIRKQARARIEKEFGLDQQQQSFVKFYTQ